MRFSWAPRQRNLTLLSRRDQGDALALCARYPLDATMIAVQARHLADNPRARSPHLVGFQRRTSHELEALAWVGANVIPLHTKPDQRAALANHLGSRRRVGSSLVGRQEEVMDLWSLLEPSWGPAGEIRETQPLLVARRASEITPDEQVRLAKPEDFAAVLPASVAMFKEEVGFDPTRNGRGYAQRVGELIRAGHTWIRTDTDGDGNPRVIFKADIGALALGVAQIQGVWMHPELRGKGMGTAALATVLRDILSSVAPTVSLYVNDYNKTALAVYRKLGMHQGSTWSTIMI